MVIEPGAVRDGASWSGGETNHFWLNLGGEDFYELSGISGADTSKDSRSYALLDFDGDGWQDFVMVNANAPFTTLYRNRLGALLAEGARAAPLRVRFRGGNRSAEPAPGWSPRDGYGAKLRVTAGGRTFLREFRCGEGLSAQNSATLTVGIGDASRAERVEVLWPSGRTTSIVDVAAGALLTFHEDAAETADGSGVVVGEARLPVALRAASAPAPLAATTPLGALLDGRSEAPFRLVMTWFDGCAACKRAQPTLEAIAAAVPAERLALFGFNDAPGDSETDMRLYVQRNTPPWTNLEARTAADIEAVKALQDRHLTPRRDAAGRLTPASAQTPCTMLLDAAGTLLWIDYGVPTVSKLVNLLDKYAAR